MTTEEQQRIIVKAKASLLEEFVKSKEEELVKISLERDEWESALKEKLQALATMPDNAGEAEEEEDAESSELSSESSELTPESSELSEDEDGLGVKQGLTIKPGETDSDTYLRQRLNDEEFKAELQKKEDARVTALKKGFQMFVLFKPKSLPFGRKKKKPKKQRVVFRLSDDEDFVIWGRTSRTVTKKLPLATLQIRYGKDSTLFNMGTNHLPWDCFTITTNKQQEFNFVCEDLNAIRTAVCGVSSMSGGNISVGRFWWLRSIYRVDYKVNTLKHLAAGVVDSDDSASEVGSQYSE